MEGYKVTIVSSTRTLTAREKIMIKDTTPCIPLDSATSDAEGGSVDINYDFHAVLAVHNPRATRPDYEKLVIVDKSGERYITGSPSLREALDNIVEEMVDAGEGDNIAIRVYRMDSNNFAGKQFLTCSLI